ncbi:metallophosphoesterase [Rodentibacter caecimuris]|uniref:Metallophosphoesterase n=1 Tax=Rodentibacter caecimuris TaxID=1796644 RepID=A0ABX3KVC9_9PAST|nr:metallophosphoesterase [Rodentibacter heylii]
MEARYYFIFVAAILGLQFFLYIFNHTIHWIFHDKGKLHQNSLITLLIFSFPNIILIGHILKFFTAYRLIALILALLVFSAFISLTIAVIHLIFRHTKFTTKIDHTLRLLYPISLITIICLSVYNAYVPKIIHYSIQLDKPLSSPIRIGIASDLHLGILFGNQQLDKLTQIMQDEKVDIILLPGDIMDDNIDAYLAENMQSHLTKLTAPLGVYATLGNHDFFGYQAEISTEIRQAGLTLLKDQSITINNKLVLIGRNDDLYIARPDTKELLKSVDTSLPIIVLDHRPTDIETHSALPIDIQVSGHTHRGQIFPANLLTALLYRLDYGYEKIGNGHFFVTSGYGFWGIPMRLGSQSEVIIVDVEGKK